MSNWFWKCRLQARCEPTCEQALCSRQLSSWLCSVLWPLRSIDGAAALPDAARTHHPLNLLRPDEPSETRGTTVLKSCRCGYRLRFVVLCSGIIMNLQDPYLIDSRPGLQLSARCLETCIGRTGLHWFLNLLTRWALDCSERALKEIEGWQLFFYLSIFSKTKTQQEKSEREWKGMVPRVCWWLLYQYTTMTLSLFVCLSVISRG